jgi:small subunit ribosomal protein S18e
MSSILFPDNFAHIIRLVNTNIDGQEKIMFALTRIKGLGKRFANLVCKKGEVDLSKRAGEFSVEKLEKLMEIVANAPAFKIPIWFLNNQKEYTHGTQTQASVAQIDGLMRDTIERLKKIRSNRGIRHYWGVRVRGQHTRTSGRGCKNISSSGKRK